MRRGSDVRNAMSVPCTVPSGITLEALVSGYASAQRPLHSSIRLHAKITMDIRLFALLIRAHS